MPRLDLRFVMTAANVYSLYHVGPDEVRSIIGVADGAFYFCDVQFTSPLFELLTCNTMRATQI